MMMKLMWNVWSTSSGVKTAGDKVTKQTQNMRKSVRLVLDQLSTPTVIEKDLGNLINLVIHAITATDTVIDRTIAGTYTVKRSIIDNIVQE